jgi:hypothetical protein
MFFGVALKTFSWTGPATAKKRYDQVKSLQRAKEVPGEDRMGAPRAQDQDFQAKIHHPVCFYTPLTPSSVGLMFYSQYTYHFNFPRRFRMIFTKRDICALREGSDPRVLKTLKRCG